MKTLYYTAASLDGFIATEDDSLEWLFPLGDINDTSYPQFFAQVGALAMGSATYEWILRHATKAGATTASPWPYVQPTWVFSRRKLPAVAGADIRFVQGDVRPVHADMVRAGGGRNIWIVGGGDLAGQFFDAGLLDQAIVQVASVTLGTGKPLFPRRVTSPPWQLLSVRQVGTGFAELHYQLPVAVESDDVPADRPAGGRTAVDLSDLEDALEWVSADGGFENAAFVSRASGEIFWTGESGVLDEEPPEDVDDASLYASVPHRKELDLGQRLVLRFVEETMPQAYDTVRGFFSRRGAYARFKDFLDTRGRLDDWHAYQDRAEEEALREWAESEGFDVGQRPRGGA